MPRGAQFSSTLGRKGGAPDEARAYRLTRPVGNYFTSPAPKSRLNYQTLVESEDGPLHYLLERDDLTVGEIIVALNEQGITQHVSVVPVLFGMLHKDDVDAICELHPGNVQSGSDEEVVARPGVRAVRAVGAVAAKGGRTKNDYDVFAKAVKATSAEVLGAEVVVGNHFAGKSLESKTYDVYCATEALHLEGAITFGELLEVAKGIYTAQQLRPGLWNMLSPESRKVMVDLSQGL
jgi:hypothetical protein